MTVVGTRPELIRLSRVMASLSRSADHVLVHTGQNYDRSLNQVFFDDLGIPAPDHYLDVDTSSLGAVLGDTLRRVEAVIREERPDAFLVLGDTNSCLAAIMAKRMRVPVYHMEAGNRCFDENVPEETNRRVIDHLADFNLVYTEHARRNLLGEGLHPRRIMLTGSPMAEVLHHYAPQRAASDVLARLKLEKGAYLVASAHREENVDTPARLDLLVDCLEAAAQHTGLKVVVSTHPRTRRALENLARATPGIDFVEPLGFHDYVQLQVCSAAALSDSGTISEEASILGFPAVTLRNSIERPEALDTGSIMMTGLDATSVVECLTHVLASGGERPSVPADYTIEDCSERVTRFILSTARLSGRWHGLHGS